MLLSYEFENFQSFLEPTVVDFTLDGKSRVTDWMALSPTGHVSKLMAAIGPNASGKTALLKPLAFMSWFVARSFQSNPELPIPVTAHFSNPDKPCAFKCTFVADGRVWRYELQCTPQRVLHEALYLRRERFGYVFVRTWDEEAQHYDIKQQDFGMAQREALKVRPNASLISTAAQYGVATAQLITSMHVMTNVNVHGRLSMDDNAVAYAAKYFAQAPNHRAQMSDLLAHWDLGLTDVQLVEVAAPTEQNPQETRWVAMGGHQAKGGRVVLPFSQESSGTRGAFVLLSLILPVLESGGLAVIDEFENDLHPLMLEPILDLFGNPQTNPHNAQMIFSCHAIEVLNLLEKSQVMLVQKDDACESAACRLDAVSGVRNDSNFYAKYMAGAYGAVPRL